MKVAVFVSIFPKISETFILNQIVGIIDAGHEVTIFADMPSYEEEEHELVKQYNLNEKTVYTQYPSNWFDKIISGISIWFYVLIRKPILAFRLLNIFEIWKYSLVKLFYIKPILFREFDIVHSHFMYPSIRAYFLNKLAYNAKFMISIHGGDVDFFVGHVGARQTKKIFDRAQLVTANTEYTKKKIITLGCLPDKIKILPESLNAKKFKFSDRALQDNKIIHFLSVSRLVEKKGHKYALEALSVIKKSMKNFKYTIIGDGPLKDDLLKQTKDLVLEDYVEVLSAMSHEKLMVYFQQAHIFLSTNVTAENLDEEGQCLVIQEAQAMGLPVISTYHNGIPEGVVEGESALLVPERNVEVLSDKIKYLMEHPKVWGEMGRAGRNFVEKKYDIEMLNRYLIEYYDFMINGKN